MQLKISAAAGGLSHLHRATHRLHQKPHHGQANATAAVAGINGGAAAGETFKDRLALASFHTRALVTHMQHQGIALLIGSKADRQRRGAVVESIFDQGGQALLQPLRIPHRHWQLRRWRV